MKKDYETPSMTVVNFDMTAPLLAGSPTTAPGSGSQDNVGTSAAKPNPGFDLWDPEE